MKKEKYIILNKTTAPFTAVTFGSHDAANRFAETLLKTDGEVNLEVCKIQACWKYFRKQNTFNITEFECKCLWDSLKETMLTRAIEKKEENHD